MHLSDQASRIILLPNFSVERSARISIEASPPPTHLRLLPNVAPDPPNAGVRGVPNERALPAVLPPGAGRPCPKVGVGAPR